MRTQWMQRAARPSAPPAPEEGTGLEAAAVAEHEPELAAPALEAEGLEELGVRYEAELARAAGEPLVADAPLAPQEPVSRPANGRGGMSAPPGYLEALNAVERVHGDALDTIRDLARPSALPSDS